MAISIEGGGRGGRRKPINAELNLVPYIDLLTCMVAFLLITAVWTQLARLQVAQHGQGDVEGIVPPPAKRLAVLVHADGFTLVTGDDQRPIPKQAGDLDYARLARELAALKRATPEKNDLQVLSEDEIPFDTLVRTMDTATGAGFSDLSLLDARTGA
jgi:biopolymer transport protein ExbD